MLNNIYGGQFNPFGPLPLGYDPNSQSSVINTGGLWRDDNTVWNLADPSGLVQSLPETQSYLRGLSYGSPYMPRLYSSANFYDNLLNQQALLAYSPQQRATNPMETMNNMFSMMVLLKQLDCINKANDKEENDSVDARERTVNDVVKDDDVADDTKIEYENLQEYSKDEFKALQEETPANTDGTKTVKLKAALGRLGIDSMPEGSMKVIARELGYGNPSNSEAFNNLEIRSAEQYKTLLEQLGFDSDKTSITKGEITENIDKIKTGDAIREVRSRDRALNDKMDNLKRLIRSGEDTNAIKSEITTLANDNANSRKFLFEKLKNKDFKLSEILKALTKNDKDNGLDDFKSVLTTLKDAAEDNNLKSDWNKILEDVDSSEKTEMCTSLNSWHFWGNAARNRQLDEMLDGSKILEAEASQPATSNDGM